MRGGIRFSFEDCQINMQISLARVATIKVFLVLYLLSNAAWAQTTLQNSPDILALQGRWVRTDAPYVIELSYAGDESLQAAYYNPRPINVAMTKSTVQKGLRQVMIELRDANYPGSTYLLSYDRQHDLLSGYYFQAVSQQTFEVVFVRQTGE